jgi:hypothetical protein
MIMSKNLLHKSKFVLRQKKHLPLLSWEIAGWLPVLPEWGLDGASP